MSDALVEKAKEAVKTASRCWGVCAGATPDGYCLCEVSARAAIAVVLEEAAKVFDVYGDDPFTASVVAEHLRKMKDES